MKTEKRSQMQGIGASEIASTMGLNPYRTPLRLWAEKTGRIPQEATHREAAEIGTELESYVARKFTSKTGIKLRDDKRTFRHPEHDFIFGHIDRIVLNEDSIFEAKTCSAYLAKAWADDEIPTPYIIQCQVYMGLTGRKNAYIAVLVGGQKFLWNELLFDPSIYDRAIQSAVDFWENYVKADMPPVAVAEDHETLSSLYPNSEERVVSFDEKQNEQVNQMIEERAGAIEAKKEAEKACKDIEAKIKQMLGEAESGQTDQYIISWKSQSRRFPDTKLMKKDGIYEKYTKPSSFRVLRTKQKKELKK